MNNLLTGLKQALQTQQKTTAQKYWAIIQDNEAEPAEVLSLSRELGKSLQDIESDIQLLNALEVTPKPDSKTTAKEVKKLQDKGWKHLEEAAKLAEEAKAKKEGGEALLQKANVTRAHYDTLENGFKALMKKLAEAGHPDFQSQIAEIEQARQEKRERILRERRESDLIAEIKRLDDAIAHNESLPEKQQISVEDLKQKRSIADRELSELREHG